MHVQAPLLSFLPPPTMVLQRYISQLLLSYAQRYISNLEASVNLWGGDMVFNNLDVRLDVLQQSLGIPAAFSLSKGFIKELRVHIPWSSITSAPVEVTFTGVEAVLTFNPNASKQPSAAAPTPPATPRASVPPGGPSTPTSASAEEESGGWASELITKIIANLSIHVHELSLKYLERDVCACLRLHSLSLHSTDPSWRSTDFMDLLGPWKLIHKALTITAVSFFLYPDDAAAAPVKNERVCILQQLSISCRIKSYLAALGATADITSWSTNALASTPTPASLLPAAASASVPSSAPSPNQKALPRPLPPPCGPAITVDVHVTEAVDLSLSSYQFERLHSLIQSKSDFYATSAAAARVAQSIAAAPAVIARDQHSKDKRKAGLARTTKKGSAAATPDGRTEKGGGKSEVTTGKGAGVGVNGGAAGSKGWVSWMWEFVAAEEEEDEDVLAVKERDDRAEFVRTMGHLAPSDEIVFCFHLSAIAVHIRSDQAETDEDSAEASDDSLPLVTELTSDSLVSPKPALPSPPRSYPLEPTTSLSSGIAVLESLSALSPSSSAASAKASAASWSSASSFASLHIHELAMILSQPLLLSKPAAVTAPPSPGSPLSSSAAAAAAAVVKPPTFAMNVVSVSVSVVDEPSAAPRAVVTFGPEFGALPASTQPLDDGLVHRAHKSKVKGRVSPFQATSCLHRNKYWDRVTDAGEQQHLLYALSIYHTVKAASSASATDSDPVFPSTSSPWAACFDVLLGPLSVSVDWSSAGTERLIHQILVFLKTVQSISAEEALSPLTAVVSSPTSTCWLQMKCAVPSCGGYILGNPCPGHGPDGSKRCRKNVVVNPCHHYTAHVEVACLPY